MNERAVTRRTFVAVVCCGWLLILACGPGRADELPDFVNWSLHGAYTQDTGLRTLVSLNGWWRWRTTVEGKDADRDGAAPSPDAAYWRKVPGIGTNFHVRDDAGRNVLASLPAAQQVRYASGGCNVERAFTLPPEWKGRDVQLVFENVRGGGEAFLDGKMLGYIWGMRWHHVDLPRPYKFGQPYRLRIRGGGVIANVWLKAYRNRDARITDSYLTTSMRTMSATLRAAGRGDPAHKVRLVITEYDGSESGPASKTVVKTVGPLPVKAAEGGWRIEHTFDWKDATLWKLSRPHLYAYYLELLDERGEVVDRITPIRFGFREVWIRGGDFMLNNRRITLTIDTHNLLATNAGYRGNWAVAGHTARPEVWRAIIRGWKKVGVNTAVFRSSMNVDDGTIFRVADEEGFLFGISTYSVQGGDPNTRNLPVMRRHKVEINRALILPRRHCPSVAFYFLPGTYNTWDFGPKKLGAEYDTEQLFGRTTRPERELIRTLDPGRFGFASSGGGKGEPVHSSMNYIHIDADLQVHETWPAWWYRTRPKPLSTYEQATPPYVADWYQRVARGDQAHGRRAALPYFLEVSAIYLGEEPYRTEPRANIHRWLRSVAAGHSVGLPYWQSTSYEKVAKLFARNVFRAWRTYGACPSFHTQVRSYFAGAPHVVKPVDVDPRRPGMFADEAISLANPHKKEPFSPVGKVARKALSPLLVYVGGPDGEFTRKDRAFHAGETVRKAVVMVSELDDPVTVTGRWELCDAAGKAVLAGNLPRTVLAPGELAPARVHIAFQAPEVTKRTEYVLKLRASAGHEGSLADEFPLAVFPTPARPSVAKGITIHLYDPIGETAALLKKAGVAFEPVAGTLPDPKTSLLVVGRRALATEEGRRGLGKLIYRGMGYDFATNVSNGMRVLVFEQPLANLWGLKTEQTRWRRAWVAAQRHPVFEGLGTGDFLYLRGDSDLAETYPDPVPGTYGRIATDRFSEWGNDNVVTTYTFVRPQVGAMRGLIHCGFDQQETPLLEVAAGRGRMMFCQVDVTNRYGVDPVSTRLVHNLIAYMTTADPPDPSVPKPTDLVREGWDDYDLDVRTETVCIVEKPEGPLSWGVSAADLYFEGFVDLPLIPGPTGQRLVYARLKDGTAVHTLNTRTFRTKWQKMKARMVRSALGINTGGSATVFPGPALQDDPEKLYPLEWLEGFVHPYLMMQW